MRGIVSEFAEGRGVIKPRDGSSAVAFAWPAIQTVDKSLPVAAEVEYEVDTGGAVVAVWLVH